jgi:hypothetical protein
MAATNGVNDQVLRWQRELRAIAFVSQKPKTRSPTRESRRRSDAPVFRNDARASPYTGRGDTRG